jgi:hypothetical protein
MAIILSKLSQAPLGSLDTVQEETLKFQTKNLLENET